MNKWIAEFELEDGDTMPEHMDLNYMGAKIDFHCRPMWIPCRERLPEEDVWTICQNNAGAMMIGKYDIEFGWMFPAYFDGIVAWMPLPEPYTKRRGK